LVQFSVLYFVTSYILFVTMFVTKIALSYLVAFKAHWVTSIRVNVHCMIWGREGRCHQFSYRPTTMHGQLVHLFRFV